MELFGLLTLTHLFFPCAFLRHVPCVKLIVESLHTVLDNQFLPCIESERYDWCATLGRLYHFGTLLEEDWATRPEYDEDENAFAALGRECLDLSQTECLTFAARAGETFVLAIEPWLSSRVSRQVFLALDYCLTVPTTRIGSM